MDQALQLAPPQSTQNSLALFTKKVSGTLRWGDTEALFIIYWKAILIFSLEYILPSPNPNPTPGPAGSRMQLHTREDTRAELETLGTLSTIACFM